MIDGWFTLRALAREWDDLLRGVRILDLYSASRDELSIRLGPEDSDSTLRISVRGGARHVFRQPLGARPKRNTTTLFEAAIRRTVKAVHVAHRDRVLDLVLDDGRLIRMLLYGSRANVLLGREDEPVEQSFRTALHAPGEQLPVPSAAPAVETADEVASRWPAGSMSMERAVGRAFPLFDPLLAAEVVDRAAVETADACLATRSDLERILEGARSVRAGLENPEPRIYREGMTPVAFSLIPLARDPAPDIETFHSVDEAVRAYIRAGLGRRAFEAEFRPLQKMLQTAADRNRVRSERMLKELSSGSRSDRYEKWGHLLMAKQPATTGRTEVAVQDLFEGDDEVIIPVDPALSAVENAERYYGKARRTRGAREQAELRLDRVGWTLRTAEQLLQELGRIQDRRSLRTWRTENADRLQAFDRERPANADALPFRRVDLGGGYEAWIGRNARENDELTFRTARKHDLWLHARGVAGSHVVLRVPRKPERPPRTVIEAAAALAARYSKASGSELVPVIVAERRFVRKPRGALPGVVIVEREEVLIVPPAADPKS